MKNDYEIRGDYAVIFLNCKGETVETKVSLYGLKKAMEFKNSWYAYLDKSKNYRVAGNMPIDSGDRKRTLLTRWVMQCDPSLQIDHINRDTLDNRCQNLRIVNNSRNAHNKTDKNWWNKTTGFRGVHRLKKNGRYAAYVYLNKKKYELGSFERFEDAKAAVIKKRKSLGLEVS